MIYKFCNIEIHDDRREVRRDGAWIQTEPKVFDVLLYLVENRDRAASRDELLRACWPNVYVSDGTLSRCLSRVRQAMGQSRSDNEPIRTLHGKGYRFVAQLEIEGDTTDLAPQARPVPADPPQRSRGLAAERRDVTALECAVALRATVGDGDPVEALLTAISRILEGIGEMIDGYEGVIVRVSGHSIGVHFGYALSPEIPARSGVSAAFEMIRIADTLGLSARVGIVSSQAIVASTPIGPAEERMVIGADLLQPSSFSDFAEDGQCVVDESTARLAAEIAQSRRIGDVSMRHGAVPAYKLTPNRGRPTVGDGEMPFHGRRVEILTLEQLWELARSGRGQAILVSGEAGVGKTRLVEELIGQMDIASQDVVVANCLANHRFTSFYPFLVEIRARIGIKKDDPPLLQLAAVEKALEKLGSPESYHLPILASLLSVDMPKRQMPRLRLDPARQHANTLEAVVRMIQPVSGGAPTLIWVEDAHWADPSTLKTLRALIASIADRPCLLVITCRSGQLGAELQDVPVRHLDLQPFSPDETRRFLTRWSDAGAIPVRLVEGLTDRSGGNPLYMRAYLQFARSADTSEAGAELPETLRAMLATRLDQLGGLKDLVRWASVLGKSFRRSVLGALCQPEGGLDEALARLEALGIFGHSRHGDGEFMEFRHGLLCEVAYELMLASDRRKRHRVVAETVIRTFPDLVRQQPERVASHFDLSETPEHAAPFWQRAGDAAKSLSSDEARGHYERALKSARMANAAVDGRDAETEIEKLLAAL